MAKFNVILIAIVALVFLFVSPKVIAEEEETSLAPEPSYAFPPEPLPGFYKYVEQCEEIVGDECGEQILLGSLMGHKYGVSLDCCKHLMVMGKHCDDALMELIIEFPEYRHHQNEVYFGGKQLWNKCEKAVEGSSPAPPQ